jgi:hypothetical protein
MNKKELKMPKFRNEGEEADWWASPLGLSRDLLWLAG